MKSFRYFNLGVVLALMLLPFVRAKGAPITVDFESFPGMTFFSLTPVPPASQLSDQLLATLGVHFQSGAGYVAVVQLGPGHAVSGINGIGAATSAGKLSYNQASPITISFFDPAHTSIPAITDFVSVRGDLDAIVGPSATLEAFDLQGQLIGSIFHTDAAGQTWSISAPGIHSVKWSGITIPDGTAGGIALDDLTFDPLVPAPPVVPPAAPFPAAVFLGLLGAAFVPAARRHCRR